MATLEENLRTFTLGAAPVAAIVGDDGMHYASIPQDQADARLFYIRTGVAEEKCLDDAVGAEPFSQFFSIECISEDPAVAVDLAGKVRDRLNNYSGAFGTQSVQLVSVDDQADDYEPLGVDDDSGEFVAALQVEIIP